MTCGNSIELELISNRSWVKSHDHMQIIADIRKTRTTLVIELVGGTCTKIQTNREKKNTEDQNFQAIPDKNPEKKLPIYFPISE